ncbi:MAG: NPCBM/NEW2 domain-containing protein [Clostridiales bacterium]|jgi:hypothetical protein|nr:NPCBM/NEW2 domain-containing protein [Clostridiales bacterium]
MTSLTQQSSYLPAKIDKSIDNHPITVNGKVYPKGFGAHARSEITVPLEGKYARFTSVIGIDDEVLPGGALIANVIFKVLLNNVEAYNSGSMRPGASKSININVAGQQSMKLVVEPNGINGNVDYAHADWANAMLEDAKPNLNVFQIPSLSQTATYRDFVANLSIDNNPITIGNRVFEYGAGAHIDSVITVPIKGKFSSLKSIIGIDDEILPGGASIANAIFKVKLDGAEVYSSGAMTLGMVKAISLSVANKQTMELIAVRNNNGDYDHTDWANAVLVRSQ